MTANSLLAHFSLITPLKMPFQRKRSRRESNPHLRFRKPPFYPLNYGNNSVCDFSAERKPSKSRTISSAHQRHKPAAAGDFEFAEDRVKVLFHHRQTQTGVIGDLLVTPPFTDKSRNFLFTPGESDKMR
jgi:hypothetical protein